MGKVKADKSGRFIRIDFPPKGLSAAADGLFLLNVLNAHHLAVSTGGVVKFSFTEFHNGKQPAPTILKSLRLVK